MKSDSLGYRPRIDGLRCFAIVLVLIHHFGGSLAGFVDLGYYGVDLFFVISGYLITGILLRDEVGSFGKAYRRFVGRRALRIFPAYYALLAVLCLAGTPPAREMALSLLTYTFNYAAALRQRAGMDNPLFYLWSLSLEEQFYLFWPPLVILLRRRPRVLLVTAGAMITIGYSQLAFGLVPSLQVFNYTGLFNRMGSLGLGSFGAIYLTLRPLPHAVLSSRRWEAAIFAVLILALSADFRARYLALGLVSLFLVVKAATVGFRFNLLDRILSNPGIVYIGAISYGIYLFHVPIGSYLTPRLVDPLWFSIPFGSFGSLERLRWHSWIIKLPLFTAISVGAASISFRWFETPILNLKRIWFPYSTVIVAESNALGFDHHSDDINHDVPAAPSELGCG